MMLRTLGFLLATTGAILLMWQSGTHAQASFNLQNDISQLRSQVQQLQSEVNQLRQRNSGGLSNPPPSLPRPMGASSLSDRSIIDRLATLAIEAKDRFNALEARLSKLEARFK
jgi:X-X-X-Leu-X-X-Gly heptad repeat protein